MTIYMPFGKLSHNSGKSPCCHAINENTHKLSMAISVFLLNQRVASRSVDQKVANGWNKVTIVPRTRRSGVGSLRLEWISDHSDWKGVSGGINMDVR